jgi:ectoine hydroxylase-related dioxygenase (phytanoyl-CoA dioxygenase family)
MDLTTIFDIADPSARAFYETHGYCILRDMRTAAECDEIVSWAHGLSGRREDDFRPLMQPHRKAEQFLRALRQEIVVGVVQDYLHAPASGLQMQFYFGAPGTRGLARHQDNFFVEAQSDAFISVWSALADITPEMGGLYLYPGSHRLGRLNVQRLSGDAGPNQDPNAYNEQTELPASAGQDMVAVSVPKGAAVVLHGDLVHGSLNNQTANFRYALLCTYIRKGADFRPGRQAQRVEIDLLAAAS